MPPQFQDYLPQAYQWVKGYADPGTYSDGTFRNADWDKMAFDYANSLWQNEYNAYQAELAFNRQKELIESQNEYNSPANQLARYMAAGLNASMIYGQIGPGLQTNVAQYQPQRSEAFTNQAMPGTTEKISRVLNVISTAASVFKAASGMASDIEGVRNQNLQNQILEARLPAEQMAAQYEANLASLRNGWLYDSQNHYDEKGQLVSMGSDPVGLLNVLFPDIYKGQLSRARSEYQTWWNDKIAPAYAQMMQGKGYTSEQEAAIREYNREMLESLPPAVRPYFAIGISLLNTIFKGNKSFGN